MNRLGSERSAYLRSAAHQPIHWHAWGEEVFERAREEDKPILLDVGAVWCHWCHVMDHESYDSAEIARIVNEKFVAVKVDRDERPDVDARYQRLVSAITGQGGWPLTAFLTPEGDVFYGGTYFPPRDAMGRPGFPRVLESVADAYANRREDVHRQARHLTEHLRGAAAGAGAGAVATEEILAAAEAALVADFDPEHGGWGSAPKFPHTAAMDFLLRRLLHGPDRASLRDVVVTTLDGMAAGGVRDHVGGGFHRYSVDARWCVPHFEKMLYDNAELLRNYARAYAVLGDEAYLGVARETMRFMQEVLARPEGGWGGSQDADVGPEDDGDFFTWTLDELTAAIEDEATRRVVAWRFHVEPAGEMHHNPAKNVLWAFASAADIASAMKVGVPEVERRLDEGLRRLAAARAARPAPVVDATVYAAWNGMAASAVLEYAAVEPDAARAEAAREAALRAIDRVLAEGYEDGKGFARALGGTVRGLLDDNAHMLAALLAAHDATGEPDYLALARDVADLLLREFWSAERGAFLDLAPALARGETGLLRAGEPSRHDNPSPSGGGVAALALLRLARMIGESRHEDAARAAVAGALDAARRAPLFSGQFLLAADALVREGASVLLAASPGDAVRFRAAAAAHPDPARTIRAVDPRAPPEALPPEAAGLLASGAPPVAVVCVGARCLLPARTPEELAERLVAALRSP